MNVAIACDHGGFPIKENVKNIIRECGYKPIDLGCNDSNAVDYPDYAKKVCQLIVSNEADYGILICGTGIGMSIAANKYPGIRCALVSDCFSAEMTRQHNDSNVLALGARVVGPDLAEKITKIFLTTDFSNLEKHENRITKIKEIENLRI